MKHRGIIARTCLLWVFALLVLSGSARVAVAGELLHIQDLSDGIAVRLVLITDEAVKPAVFTLDNPPRIVIDLPNTFRGPEFASATATSTLPVIVGDADVTGVRVGQFSTETLRVVLDLSGAPRRYEVHAATGGPGAEVLLLRRHVVESVTPQEAPPGMTLTTYIKDLSAGPLIFHALDIDPADPHVSFGIALANNKLRSRERLSGMVKRKHAIAAVNGGYFDMDNGDLIDMLIMDGKMVTTPVRRRGFLGFTSAGKPVFCRPRVSMSVKAGQAAPCEIKEINRPPWPGQMVVFTPDYGANTGTDPARTEIIVSNGSVTGIASGSAPIPPDGFVISADDYHYDTFTKNVAVGDPAAFFASATPDISLIYAGVNAGPLLIADGAPVPPRSEEFDAGSSIITGRHPRTAVCYTSAGRLIFLAVEGRYFYSAGAILPELTSILMSLGCQQAINLDGGGSTEMIVDGKIVNYLSDGGERPVANGFMIYYK